MVRSLVRAVGRQWLPGAVAFVATVVLGLFFTGAPVTFTARAQLVLPPISEASLQRQAQEVLSDRVLERAARDAGAKDPEAVSRAVEELREAVAAHRAKDSSVIDLVSTDARGGRAVDRVNAVGRAFEASAREESRRELDAVDAALKKHARRIAELKGRLAGAPAPAATPEGDPGLEALAKRLTELDRTAAVHEAEAEALGVRIDLLVRRLESGDVDPAGPVDTTESDRLSRELAAALRMREEVRRSEGEDASALSGLTARVELLKRQRDESARREGLEHRFAPVRGLLDRIQQASAHRRELERSAVELKQIRKKLAGRLGPGTPATIGSDAETEAELAWVRATVTDLRGLRARLAAEQELASGPVARFEAARSASVAGAPILYVLLAALVVALAVALGTEAWTPTIRTDHDISRYVNLPLLGIIPAARSEEERLLLQAGERAPILETFNTVATLVESRAKEDASKVFAVTSAVPEEGKSTVACNLAVALAGGGAQVLLVDGDLRRSVQHRLLSTASEPGLSSYLMGVTDDLDSILVRPQVENLSLLPAGPLLEAPHPFLRSERFRALVPELRERFDYVIFDLPPVRSVADGLLVAPLVDGVILVISASETGKDDATAAKRLIRTARGRLIGCVLNKATVRSRGYYSYSAAAAAAAE